MSKLYKKNNVLRLNTMPVNKRYTLKISQLKENICLKATPMLTKSLTSPNFNTPNIFVKDMVHATYISREK